VVERNSLHNGATGRMPDQMKIVAAFLIGYADRIVRNLADDGS
jgi:hypothetical protein